MRTCVFPAYGNRPHLLNLVLHLRPNLVAVMQLMQLAPLGLPLGMLNVCICLKLFSVRSKILPRFIEASLPSIIPSENLGITSKRMNSRFFLVDCQRKVDRVV